MDRAGDCFDAAGRASKEEPRSLVWPGTVRQARPKVST